MQGDGWQTIRSGVTNDDGRVANLLTPSESLYPGVYRMMFYTGDYFENVRGVAHFYPRAGVEFKTTDRSGSDQMHAPLPGPSHPQNCDKYTQ